MQDSTAINTILIRIPCHVYNFVRLSYVLCVYPWMYKLITCTNIYAKTAEKRYTVIQQYRLDLYHQR